MITNTDATLYHRIHGMSKDGDGWQRVYLPAVWWYENVSSSITTNGMKMGNGATSGLTVRVPDICVRIQKGDYIVKGNCDVEMVTVKSLSGISHYCVTGVNYNAFGSRPHVKVVGVKC